MADKEALETTPPVAEEAIAAPKTKSEAKAIINKMLEKLQKMDDQKHGGARSRLPKARMLDASALESKDPEHHYCYVNTEDEGNLQGHADDGYVAVPEKEAEAAGVRVHVGETRLMRVPRKIYEEKMDESKRLNDSRLRAHRAEVREAVAAVHRELQKRGYDIPLERLLVDE